MSSLEAYRSHAQILPNHENETPISTPIFRPPSRRTPSFGSSSSSLSSRSSDASSIPSFPDPCEYSPIFSPRTPLRFSGIPFSWEQTPGIPKNEMSHKKQSSNSDLLPLPPAGSSSSISFRKKCKEQCGSLKKLNNEIFQQDPFFAALMECSRDDQEVFGKILKTPKIYKGLVDRLAMYISCKRVSAVSQSIVFLPRSRDHVSRRPV